MGYMSETTDWREEAYLKNADLVRMRDKLERATARAERLRSMLLQLITDMLADDTRCPTDEELKRLRHQILVDIE